MELYWYVRFSFEVYFGWDKGKAVTIPLCLFSQIIYSKLMQGTAVFWRCSGVILRTLLKTYVVDVIYQLVRIWNTQKCVVERAIATLFLRFLLFLFPNSYQNLPSSVPFHIKIRHLLLCPIYFNYCGFNESPSVVRFGKKLLYQTAWSQSLTY